MDTALPYFIAVTALAVVLQAGVMVALYLSVRKTNEKLTRSVEDLRRQLEPILGRVQILVDDAQPRLSAIIANAAEVTELARGQAYKVDRVFTEAVDRLRLQVIRADQLLTGFLESIEETGAEVKKTVWEPVRQATAVIRGVKAGLEFFRSGGGQRRESGSRERTRDEEELFI
jgi:uncharacterized protein YoxC